MKIGLFSTYTLNSKEFFDDSRVSYEESRFALRFVGISVEFLESIGLMISSLEKNPHVSVRLSTIQKGIKIK